MRTMIARALVALSAVFYLAGTGLSAPPLSDKMPEETIVYVGWAGRSLTFDGSMFGQLIAEPEIAELFGAINSAATAGVKTTGDPNDQALFESLWSMASIAWRHPAAAGVFGVAPPGAMDPAGRDRQPMLTGAILVDLQKDRADFTEHFQKLLSVAEKKVKLSRASVGNISYYRFETEWGDCSMGFIGDVFFVSLGDGTPLKLAAVAQGKAKPLAGNADFTAAMKEVSGQNVQAAYYADVARLIDVAEKTAQLWLPGLPVSATSSETPGEENPFRRIVKALGVDGVTAIAGASNIVDRGFYGKCRVFSPAPHRGVLMLLAGKPLPAGALEGAPADVDFVCTMNLDPAELLVEIKRIAAAIDPSAGEQVDAALASAGEAMGLDIEKDLLANMGDQWTLISAPSLGGTLTGTALVVQLKDARKFSASLAKLQAQLARMLGGEPRPGPATAPVKNMELIIGERAKPTIHSFKSGDIEIHYVAIPGSGMMPMPVAPAWAVHGGNLYVAAFPQVVAAAAGGVRGKSLAESAAFAANRKRMGPSPSALSYTNTPSLLRRFYGVLLLGGTAMTNTFGQLAPAIRPEILPPLPKIEKYVWPDISAISADANGITFESYGSLPSWFSSQFYTLHLQATSLGASMLFPALSKAKQNARQVISMANLRGIGQGIAIHVAGHDDRFPPDLLTLIEEQLIPGQMLYSPSSGREVKLDSAGNPVGPLDYVYLGGQMDPDAPGDLIIAYERPEINNNTGTNVLYVAGNVKWVTVEQFRSDLARTREYIKKRQGGDS